MSSPFAGRIEQAGGSGDDLARAVEFLREFADKHHHGKEEAILFSAMVEEGFPQHGGPVAVMLHEHDLGRKHLRELAARATETGAWSAADRDAVVLHARGYVTLLRAHIQKEDAVLFPMADQCLAGTAADRVREQFDAFERERAVERRRLEAVAADLIRRYVSTGNDVRPAVQV